MGREPAISVVMGVYNGAAHVCETIESVLCQTEADFEFILVNDGSEEPAVAEILADYARRDVRLRVITKPNEGLTKALIDGCAAAEGKYIARIDNGDVMSPERLAKQRAVLDAHPDAVLATCWTEFCGPEWEPLYTIRNVLPEESQQESTWKSPFPGDGDDNARRLGPTSHPSVILRADAYRKVGGYRRQFYYGQDWDLWYRLAEIGKFSGVQETLYRCRVLPDGISMRNVERQRKIHDCSHGAFLARQNGDDETPFLEAAASIRPGALARNGKATMSSDQRLAAGCYFIGEALRRNRDRRCRNYLMQAILQRPFDLRIWVRFVQGLFI